MVRPVPRGSVGRTLLALVGNWFMWLSLAAALTAYPPGEPTETRSPAP